MNDNLTEPPTRAALEELMAQNGFDAANFRGPYFNESHSAETRDALGAEIFGKLRAQFMREVDDFQTWLTSPKEDSVTNIAAKSHNLAGSAAVFGADLLRQNLQQIETAAKCGDGPSLDRLVQEFRVIWGLMKLEM